MDAAIYGNVLWIALLSDHNNDEIDLYFCDLAHFLNKRVPANAQKWKFQRMWKRAEYIERILRSIESEFNFNAFYAQFVDDKNGKNNYKNKQNEIEKIHEKVLN